jgi:hypothetical protein
MPARRCFRLVLVKPSHYDDDGYVIRWWRAMIPSNSLAAVYGIATDCAERRVLGPDIAIAIDAIDETHTRVNVPELIERLVVTAVLGCLRSLASSRTNIRAPSILRARFARPASGCNRRISRVRLCVDA